MFADVRWVGFHPPKCIQDNSYAECFVKPKLSKKIKLQKCFEKIIRKKFCEYASQD